MLLLILVELLDVELTLTVSLDSVLVPPVPQASGGRRPSFADALAIGIVLAALLYLIAGRVTPTHLPLPGITSLQPELSGQPLFTGDGFAPNAVFPTTGAPTMAAQVLRVGSWIGSDRNTGSVTSAWFRPARSFSILVAGYPADHGCQLWIESQNSQSSTWQTAIATGENPAERWRTVDVSLSSIADARRFRIVAVDSSTAPGGWVAFSQPFTIDHADNGELCKQFALLLFSGAATLTALLLPGLLLLRRSLLPGRAPLCFVWVPVPGFFALALLGLLCWFLPRSVPAGTAAEIVLAPTFLFALYFVVRHRLTEYTTGLERRILLAILCLILLAVGKETYSPGPPGELYGGTISRSLEVGDRSDSRIPFIIVQLIANKSKPYSPFANSLFSPYNFSSRGPLPGFAVTPIVTAGPTSVPMSVPDQPWTVFDPQGFAAYRTAMIVIAACSLISVFGVAGLFVDERWAFLALLLTATTPFVIHEVYFTWPKLEAVWFVMMSAYVLTRGRSVAAGFLLAAAYLCHPLALLSVPALVAYLFLLAPEPLGRKLRQTIVRTGLLAASLFFCMALWALINRRHFSQGGFLDYFLINEYGLPTVANWIHSRWDSVCNTLVPLNLFLFHSDHHSINSIYGRSPGVVHFVFQYWNTLPFGVGICYFFPLLYLLYVGARRAFAWFLLLIVFPFSLFAVYWGLFTTGLLREGLHVWVVTVLIFSVVMWKKIDRKRGFYLVCCWALALRGIETLSMLVLPAMTTQDRIIDPQFGLTDVASLILMGAASVALYVGVFRWARSLEPA